MVVALWALTVFGVEMGVRAAAGSRTVFFCWLCTVVAMCMPSIYMQKWRDVTHCDCGAMRVPVLLCDAVVRVVCGRYAFNSGLRVWAVLSFCIV